MKKPARRQRGLLGARSHRGFLLSELVARQYEVFALVLLDKRGRLIEYVEAARGTQDIVNIYPREIVRLALRRNASSVILAHNHPSGDSTP